jgi:hypothetical protein
MHWPGMGRRCSRAMVRRSCAGACVSLHHQRLAAVLQGPTVAVRRTHDEPIGKFSRFSFLIATCLPLVLHTPLYTCAAR